MTDEQMREWIDSATHEQLLRKWRTAPVGDPFFQGDLGQYYANAMKQKRQQDPRAAVAASKRIGW